MKQWRFEVLNNPGFSDVHGKSVMEDVAELGIRSVQAVQSARVFLVEADFDRDSAEQVAQTGAVDVLLMPVGGFYTIDANVASRVAEQLKPRVVIPMHFKNERCDFPISGVAEFLRGKKDISQPDASEVEFKAAELPPPTQIIVLKPAR